MNRWKSEAFSVLKTPSSLDLLYYFLVFLTPILSSLTARGWLAVTILFPPSISVPSHCKLRNLLLDNITGFLYPGQISWTETSLRLLRWMGEIKIFQKRSNTKRITEEASPLSRNCTPCFLSHAAKISTPIWLLRPPWLNFPGYISPPFCW